MPNSSDGAPHIQPPPPKRGLRERLSTPSWVLYDFSDTIFSFSILTFYFPLWVTREDIGGTDALFTGVLALSSFVVAISAPMFGTISDRMGRRIPPLAVCILTCVLCTAMIGSFGGLSVGLVLFVAANFLYQTGLIFYNSLIVNVSSESNRGVISGVGVGAGYIGLIVAFVVMRPIVNTYGDEWAFILTASLYMLFSLPLLILIRESGISRRVDAHLVRDSYTQLYRTFQRAQKHANMFRFILCRLAYMEAVNTIASIYVLYLINVGDFTREQAQNMIFITLFIATVSSIFAGFLVSRTSPKKVLTAGIGGWTVVLIVASFVNVQWMFWAIALVMGVFWAVPQIADRVLLTRLAPEGQVGEFFGLFAVTGRLSSVIGPALWTLTLSLFAGYGTGAYRISLLVMGVFLIVGLLLLLWVREEREESDLSYIDDND